METSPERLVDTHFIPFQEAGRTGTYYFDMASGDIQRHPGWYDLPRGGILAEQMGTGKTLAVLTLVVGTLHTPPTPPSDVLDISPVLSSQSLTTYPFTPYARARSMTNYPDVPDVGLPSLVSLCAGVLARTDTSAIASMTTKMLPEEAERILRQRTFFYEYPIPDDCIRRVRQKTEKLEAKKTWLANTTLIVVPQILMEQWVHEIEKHLEPETLKVLEIGKEAVPPVSVLMQ